MKSAIKFFLFLIVSTVLSSCGENTDKEDPARQSTTLDIAKIEQVLDMQGTAKDGEYKITVAQNDLNVVVDSFKIIPPMGLSSWAAFTSTPDGAMVMGDIIVTETDLKPVQKEVIKTGANSYSNP